MVKQECRHGTSLQTVGQSCGTVVIWRAVHTHCSIETVELSCSMAHWRSSAWSQTCNLPVAVARMNKLNPMC